MKVLDSGRNRAAIERFCAGRVAESSSVEKSVRSIIDNVRKKGDAALRAYTRKFDGVTLRSFRVQQSEIDEAFAKADPAFVAILQEAAGNIRAYHRKQLQESWSFTTPEGSTLGQRITPIERAGVYIPGGKAAYPSTVLMNVIPAQVAGVASIQLVSPPDGRGRVNADVLTAARVLGVDSIFKIGGAQAIAALAYGTRTIPRVDKIVGPGNIFVATAKKLVFGRVGIDSFAGPSEVVILAGPEAKAGFVAADMLAQAEHDEHASCVLITPVKELADAVGREIARLIKTMSRKKIIERSLAKNGTIILARSIEEGADIVNRLAPEHLEIITADDWETMKLVKHAGAIFLGNPTPVAIGDYFAGPNHTLPTNTTARFSSPLGTEDFLKRTSVIAYTDEHIAIAGGKAASFASKEGLEAHALSITARIRR